MSEVREDTSVNIELRVILPYENVSAFSRVQGSITSPKFTRPLFYRLIAAISTKVECSCFSQSQQSWLSFSFFFPNITFHFIFLSSTLPLWELKARYIFSWILLYCTVCNIVCTNQVMTYIWCSLSSFFFHLKVKELHIQSGQASLFFRINLVQP